MQKTHSSEIQFMLRVLAGAAMLIDWITFHSQNYIIGSHRKKEKYFMLACVCVCVCRSQESIVHWNVRKLFCSFVVIKGGGLENKFAVIDFVDSYTFYYHSLHTQQTNWKNFIDLKVLFLVKGQCSLKMSGEAEPFEWKSEREKENDNFNSLWLTKIVSVEQQQGKLNEHFYKIR